MIHTILADDVGQKRGIELTHYAVRDRTCITPKQ
jgi:hypothetical protein